MTKHVIREDALGIYVQGGGYVSRPAPNGIGHKGKPTAYKAGDEVSFSHSGGPATRVGGELWWIVDESDPARRAYDLKMGWAKCLNCGVERGAHAPTFKDWDERGCANPEYPS